MKKTVFSLSILCLLAGCAGPEPTLKVGVQSSEGLPLKVDIKADQELPVVVKTQDAEGLPVKLNETYSPRRSNCWH